MAEDTEDQTPTLADIAARAGVVTSTVSRALRNPNRVSATTRKRILRIASDLGYESPRLRHTAVMPRTGTVGVLVSDIGNPFFMGIIRGTQRQLRAAGMNQLLIDTEESETLEEASMTRLRSSCDGVVVAASRLSDIRLRHLASSIPLVAINRGTSGVPTVSIDSPLGFEQAVEHLVSLGHRRIVYVAGPPKSWSNASRWQAFRRATRRHDIEPLRVGPFPPDIAAGSAAADAVLNTGATGCCVFNDLLAIGLLVRLHARGVSVPARLSIVGCDDIFGADICSPPLTTLTAPIEQAGRAAAAMLLDILSTTASVDRTVVLPTRLTIRGSSGPAPERS